MSPLKLWFVAARPRTLPAAVAPVLVGTALAIAADSFGAVAFVAALVGSVFLQIGTNLANDYSDARRGADTEDRLGPVRVTAGGLMPPRRVLTGTYMAFGVACVAGVVLTVIAGPVMLAVGAASIVAGVLYTGGPRPYGYSGLGELFVFVFFGVVAVVFTFYAQAEDLPVGGVRAFGPGRAAGRGDPGGEQRPRHGHRPARGQAHPGREAGPRAGPAAVRRDAGGSYLMCVVIPAAGGLSWWTLLPLLSIPLAVPLRKTVATRTDGPALNGALAGAGRLLGVFSALLAVGVLLS